MLRSFPGLRDFHQELSLEKKADWICLPFNHQFYRQKWTQLINYLSQRAEIWYASYWWPWLRTQQISLISLQQFFFSILGLSLPFKWHHAQIPFLSRSLMLTAKKTTCLSFYIEISTRNATLTIWFFKTATKEHFISRLFDELDSSSWSQIKGNWLRFLFLRSISSSELMQSFKNS